MYGPYLRNCSLLAMTDNISDVHIINRQRTSSSDLQVLLRSIYRACAEYNINLRAEHVPGVENDVADLLSRPARHLHDTHVPLTVSHTPIQIEYVHSSSLKTDGCPCWTWTS